MRSVQCICPPCIQDNGQRCENLGQADPWKLVTLKPSKGSNLNKYKKRPRSDRKVVEKRSIQQEDHANGETRSTPQEVQEHISYDAAESIDDNEEGVENDEITFEIIDDDEVSTEEVKEQKQEAEMKTKSMPPDMDKSSKTGKNVTDRVTDRSNITDQVQEKRTTTWVNVNEEITEQDFLSESGSETNEVEILDICEHTSKEFQFFSENILPSAKCASTTEITALFKQDIPKKVLWASILTAMEDCTDFNQLHELCQALEKEMPPLQPRVMTSFTSSDSLNHAVQSEIPTDGPKHLRAVLTDSDGNCLPRSLGQGYFNDASKHLEIRARLVVEGVLQKDSYLNDDCLERGASYIYGNADLPTIFTTFSEYYNPGQKLTKDSIECIYCMEVHSIAKQGTYMGLWQLTQAASVFSLPLHTAYPVRGQSSIQNDFTKYSSQCHTLLVAHKMTNL